MTGQRSQKKRGNFFSNADEDKVDEKKESEKPCTVAIDTRPPVCL